MLKGGGRDDIENVKAGGEISLGVWEQGCYLGWHVCRCATLPRAVYGPKVMLWRGGGWMGEWMGVGKWFGEGRIVSTREDDTVLGMVVVPVQFLSIGCVFVCLCVV